MSTKIVCLVFSFLFFPLLKFRGRGLRMGLVSVWAKQWTYGTEMYGMIIFKWWNLITTVESFSIHFFHVKFVITEGKILYRYRWFISMLFYLIKNVLMKMIFFWSEKLLMKNFFFQVKFFWKKKSIFYDFFITVFFLNKK